MLAKASIPQTLPVQMLAPVSEFMWRRKNEIHYIGGSEVLPAPLEPEKEAQAIESLVGETSAQARELLIEHNLRLVVYIAKKFDNTGVGVEDLISIGTIGLIIARLSDRERVIIQLRFGLGSREGKEKTQKEVADMLGISQSYISRLEKKIIGRLRKEIVKGY